MTGGSGATKGKVAASMCMCVGLRRHFVCRFEYSIQIF